MNLDGTTDRRPSAQRRSELGEGKLKAVVVTAALLLFIYSAVKVVPPYVQNYQLQDKMQEQARFAVVNHYTEEQVRETIYKEVQELDIPVKREEIKIVANMSVVKISLDYTVPIDLLFYHLDLHFSPTSENKSLI